MPEGTPLPQRLLAPLGILDQRLQKFRNRRFDLMNAMDGCGVGGGDAPWCRCPSEWCQDVNYMDSRPHDAVSCSAASTAADLNRFNRNESDELSYNSSIGRWTGYAYQTDPVKSYADMALYYTKKMLETFADGVYYDDCFLHANFVPAPAGPAYVDENGTLRAGVSIWAWREFMRRSATMQHTLGNRKGKPTIIYMHMTNVNVIPWLSWGSVNLDWEWRDQNGLAEEDVPGRVRRESTRRVGSTEWWRWHRWWRW